MKKFLLAGLLLFGFSTPSHAIFEWASRQDCYTIRYSSSNLVTSTSAVLVDLSDTVNYPHRQTGAINVSSVRIDMGKVAATTGTLKIGVVTKVDTSSGSITWFFGHSFDRDITGTHITENSNYSDVSVRTRVVAGSCTYIVSNDKDTNSTVFQTDVNLPTTFGTDTAPGVGDIVFKYTANGTTAADINIELVYFSER